jgi:hypothetical protein
MPDVTTRDVPIAEIFKRLTELEAGRAENNKQIEIDRTTFTAALVRLEEKFVDELRGIHEVLKTIAKGESFGCMTEAAAVASLQKDVAALQKAIDSKADRDFVDTTADKKAREVVALALVEAKKEEDKNDAVLNTKMNGLYLLLTGVGVTILTFAILHFMGKI